MEYLLTPVGAGLSDVIAALGTWTRDWHLKPSKDQGPDAATVLWLIYRTLDISAIPRAGIGIEFRFVGSVPARGWIHADRHRTRAGFDGPGSSVDLVVVSKPRVLEGLWTGARQCDPTIESGEITFEGPASLAHDFRHWFTTSAGL